MRTEAHEVAGCSPPTVFDVDRIAAHAEPVVRNLQITLCYHELSLAMAKLTGGGANWCTFAVWASKQVGQTIRQEDLARTFERLMGESPEAAAGVGEILRGLRRVVPRRTLRGAEWLVLQAALVTTALDGAGEAAARGNRKVFEEIAREFARFVATFADEPVEDERRIAEFCEGLRPGEPPDGQHYLRQAFTHYYRAVFARDAKHRTELLLLANLEVGLHEQTRLQPEITAALEAAVIDPGEFERRLLEVLVPGGGLIHRLRLALSTLLGWRSPVRAACEHLADHARAMGRRAVTEHLMTLSLPGGQVLDLGRDLRAEFPPPLAELVDLELRALVEQVDPTADSLIGTAARDWSDLPDRMHYIADMFRCYAQREDLLGRPFTADQAEAIRNGRRPAGRL